MLGKWSYEGAEQFAYGDETTYRKAMTFLDGCDVVEDWGCGTAYARRFLTQGRYLGIDGSASRWTDVVCDLREYRSQADGILIRHVLEHNHEWRRILAGAVASFRRRLALVTFTPFGNETRVIATNPNGTPDISFREEDITELFKRFVWRQESCPTRTQYNSERVFYVERRESVACHIF